jgi:hypothetical protein
MGGVQKLGPADLLKSREEVVKGVPRERHVTERSVPVSHVSTSVPIHRNPSSGFYETIS